jgi:hypothetical protein
VALQAHLARHGRPTLYLHRELAASPFKSWGDPGLATQEGLLDLQADGLTTGSAPHQIPH